MKYFMLMIIIACIVYVVLSKNNYYMRADRKFNGKEILEDKKGNPVLVKKYPFISMYFEGDEFLADCIIWVGLYISSVLALNILVPYFA